jgi:predicted RNA-binding Zn ribbon-like protein
VGDDSRRLRRIEEDLDHRIGQRVARLPVAADRELEVVFGLVRRRRAGRGSRKRRGADLVNAVTLRESFRSLLAGNNGVAVDDATMRAVNDALRRCRVEVVFRTEPWGVEYRSSAKGADRILGTYLCAMLASVDDGSWSRLKVCANPDCRWAFFDRSRKHAGTWCDMATCGSVFKMRRHRQRQRTQRAADAGTSQAVRHKRS